MGGGLCFIILSIAGEFDLMALEVLGSALGSYTGRGGSASGALLGSGSNGCADRGSRTLGSARAGADLGSAPRGSAPRGSEAAARESDAVLRGSAVEFLGSVVRVAVELKQIYVLSRNK